MIFYHGTSQKNWESIKKEGVLFGVRDASSRCTYLVTEQEEAKMYGDVVLEVNYDPFKNPGDNNYCDGCWQVRVYEPIPISEIKVL